MKNGRSGLLVTIAVVAVTLLAVGGFVFWQSQQPNAADEAAVETTNTEEAAPSVDEEVVVDETTPGIDSVPDDVVADPASLSSIDIEPLGVAVLYTKGIPGFEFAVKRTASGTQYVEFSAPELVGTKCTDDQGVFLSIVKNPSGNEDDSTITSETKVGSDTYGLALSGNNCTSDQALFAQYQTAFSNGFSSMRPL